MPSFTSIQRVIRLFPWRRQEIQGEPHPERYGRSADGHIIVRVHLNSPSALLMPFERFPSNFGNGQNNSSSNSTPPSILNLNSTLVDYLFKCVAEVGDERLLLRVDMPFDQEPDTEPLSANAPVFSAKLLQMTIQRYFAYVEELRCRNLKQLARDACALGLFGIGALGLSVILDSYITQIHTSFVLPLVLQGITVLGWLTLWEALANALWHWRPLYQQLRICQQLQQAQFELTNSAKFEPAPPSSHSVGS